MGCYLSVAQQVDLEDTLLALPEKASAKEESLLEESENGMDVTGWGT